MERIVKPCWDLKAIPLDETIDIYVNQAFKNTNTVEELQSQNLDNYYVWLQRSPILYLTVYFTIKLMF